MDEVPDLIDDDRVQNMEEEDEDDALWEDCDNEEQMVITSKCLFCDEQMKSPHEIYRHCAKTHSFNINSFQQKYRLEYLDYIKMINFCRAKNIKSDDLALISSSAWQSEEYLKPVLPDDGLLQFDIDDVEDLNLAFESASIDQSKQKDNPGQCPKQNGQNAGDNQGEPDLIDRCKRAEERANELEQALQQAVEDIDKMRSMAGSLLTGSVDVASSHDAIKHLNEDEDEAYVSGYSHFSIHEEMLKDKVRTEYYRDCIYKNKDLFKDKVVLDVGCGTGILSMFAAKAGAKKVIGVDMSDIIYQAMDIVRENGYEDRITLLKGRMEDLTLPVDKVDIIISEWMGYFLLFESMLDTVLWARDHYLADDGLILPDYCDMFIAGIADTNMVDAHVKYWEDVYGFKMNCMKSSVVREASVGIVKADTVATEPARIKEIDICTCSTKDLEFTSPFKMTVTRDTELTAIVGYFDIKWVLKDKACCFSTNPVETPTHWKQTIYMLETPLSVKKGDVLEGNIICKKSRNDPRSLDITLTLEGKTQTYILT